MHYDFLVIGAGPAGVQLGYFLENAGCSYRILDGATEVGSFFGTFPRSRQLISFNKVNSIYDDPETRLRWDWNSLLTTDYGFLFGSFSQRLYPSAGELREYLTGYARKYSLNISLGTPATRVSRRDDGAFVVTAASGERLTARCLVVATGFSKPYIPPIPGIELAEGYETVPMDPEAYHGQRLLIIGKGNSAGEVAEVALERAALIHLASAHSIRLAWQTRHPGHLRATNMRLLDMYQLKLLNSALDCVVERIVKVDRGFAVTVAYVHADGERETIIYDRVVRCTGFRFDDSVFSGECRPALTIDNRLPAMRNNWESANVPGMFFAGTLMQAIDFRRASSAFIDGFRYNIRTLTGLLTSRYCGTALPARTVAAAPEALAAAVIARVSRSSGLWAQFGFLCDVIRVTNGPSGAVAVINEELPSAYVHEDLLPGCPHYYTVDFEWGRWDGDVFAIDRHPSHEMAHTNVFLHPIVRRYRSGELVAEHHILEDLLGMYCAAGESGVAVERAGHTLSEYHARHHYQPLVEFFAADLARA